MKVSKGWVLMTNRCYFQFDTRRRLRRFFTSSEGWSSLNKRIGELKTLRQKLATDGSRLERQLAEYARLSQSVTQLTKIIAEGLTYLEKGPSLRERPVAWQ